MAECRPPGLSREESLSMIGDSYRELTGRALPRHLSADLGKAQAELLRVSRVSMATPAADGEGADNEVEAESIEATNEPLSEPEKRASCNNVWRKAKEEDGRQSWTTGDEAPVSEEDEQLQMVRDSYRELTGSAMPRRLTTSLAVAQAELRRASSAILDLGDEEGDSAQPGSVPSQTQQSYALDLQSAVPPSTKPHVKPLGRRMGSSLMSVLPTVPASPRMWSPRSPRSPRSAEPEGAVVTPKESPKESPKSRKAIGRRKDLLAASRASGGTATLDHANGDQVSMWPRLLLPCTQPAWALPTAPGAHLPALPPYTSPRRSLARHLSPRRPLAPHPPLAPHLAAPMAAL